ncbi:MAG: hypothetical protein Q9O62_07120 [Ardenticatenia bacterium]|nr:hypothetical protein [Ardenticatenia bacterium]
MRRERRQLMSPQRAVLVPQELHTLPSAGQLRCALAALLVVLATAGLYLTFAYRLAGELGLPLDDAWIHQTYARNLAELNQWVYTPGTFSAGSTAPLWTILLSLAYALPGSPLGWTYGLGLFFLVATAWMGYRLSRLLFGEQQVAWATAFALLLEWHLAWSGVSGMEIPLYTFFLLWLLVVYAEHVRDDPRPISWGALGGLLMLIRPESVLLTGLVAAHFLAVRRRQAIRPLLLFAGSWALVVAPYVGFNWMISGALFPNTFYAKQMEYAEVVRRLPLWRRFLQQAWQPFVGAQVLLLPGLAWLTWQAVRRGWSALLRPEGALALPLAWAIAVVSSYALRLPVTYQHGRYMMPLIPLVIVYGLGSTWQLVRRLPSFVLRRAWAVSVAALLVIFWARGALAYGEDTAIITCEAVETARWVAQNTPTDALIAAHDIGALGYFASRPLLDLAGLVSPEVIPIIRDEAALADYLAARGADYLVVAPDWYPNLVRRPGVNLIYQRACPLTQRSGYASTAVYQLEWQE